MGSVTILLVMGGNMKYYVTMATRALFRVVILFPLSNHLYLDHVLLIGTTAHTPFGDKSWAFVKASLEELVKMNMMSFLLTATDVGWMQTKFTLSELFDPIGDLNDSFCQQPTAK